MKKSAISKKLHVFIALLIVGFTADAGFAMSCISTAAGTIKFGSLPGGGPKAIAGKIAGTDVPFSGVGYKKADGTRVIGGTLIYDWAGGGWINPVGNLVITISTITRTGTYDLTYFGASAPVTYTGTANIVSCIGVPFDALQDPNAE